MMLLEKLQFRGSGPLLVLNRPREYELPVSFHTEIQGTEYPFIQVFGTNQRELEELAQMASEHISNEGLLWVCYPKKSSKKYQSDCSRDKLSPILEKSGFMAVRLISINDDWSAMRFRRVEQIKALNRKLNVLG